ncbi:MAG TPA: nuclear transport factor 2 family protein [Longimicrobiales bacterium]|nr:nuclear transport factor 2 family protein [Longimicrobiales bacterium]
MIRRSVFVLAGSLLLPLGACAPDPEVEETPAPAAEEIEAAAEAPPADLLQAQEAYLAAWNADDLAALSAFFVDDATARIGDETYTGRQQLETNWLQPRQAISSDLTTTETNRERRGDDWHVAGTYTTTVTQPGAAPVQASGRYSVTWTRTPEGQWRIRSSEVIRDPLPQN